MRNPLHRGHSPLTERQSSVAVAPGLAAGQQPQGREWYRQLFVPAFYIDSWEVAWSNRGPRGYVVFLGRRTDGRMFMACSWWTHGLVLRPRSSLGIPTTSRRSEAAGRPCLIAGPSQRRQDKDSEQRNGKREERVGDGGRRQHRQQQ